MTTRFVLSMCLFLKALALGEAALAATPPGKEVWSTPDSDVVSFFSDRAQIVLAKDVPGRYTFDVPEGPYEGTWAIEVAFSDHWSDGSATFKVVDLVQQRTDISYDSLLLRVGDDVEVMEVGGELALVTDLGLTDANIKVAFFRDGDSVVLSRPGLFIDCWVLPGGWVRVCYTYMEQIDGTRRNVVKVWIFRDGAWHLVILLDTDWLPPQANSPSGPPVPASLSDALAAVRDEVQYLSGDGWGGFEPFFDDWLGDASLNSVDD